MKKSLSASGINGTFHGEVEIVFNAERRTKQVHNRSTHDEETVIYYVHQIKGSAGSKDLPVSETEQDKEIPELADGMEKQVLDLLKWQANREKNLTTVEILKCKGYW